MNKLLLSAAIAIVSATGAQAADIAARPYTKAPPIVAPVYNWGGFYVGANAGYGTDRNCWTDITGGGNRPMGCHDASGAVAGGQIGYRWQATNWVFGLEAQGNWADLRGTHLSLINAAQNEQSRLTAFGLFTGQIGYAWNNTLLYVKGGAALTDNSYRDLAVGTGALNSSAKETMWGATVGAGLEYGFAPNWSVAVEYDHVFMRDTNNTFFTPLGAVFGTARVTNDIDLVMGRINYRFNWGATPVVAKY